MVDTVLLVLALFGIVGGIDRILGNRFGLGQRFEEGFKLIGTVAFSMVGIYSLSPVLAEVLHPFLRYAAGVLHIDPSIIISSLLACDMGAYNISLKLAADNQTALFSGLIIASMMGATVSFTMPIAFGMVKEENYKVLAEGIAIGIIAIPVGAIFGGITAGMPVDRLTFLIFPLFILSLVLYFALKARSHLMLQILIGLGRCIVAINIIGIMVLILQSLTKVTLLKDIIPLTDCMSIVGRIAFVLSGTYVFIEVLYMVLGSRIRKTNGTVKINESTVIGLVTSLASNIPMFAMFDNMDYRGKLVNAAFSVSGAFVFGGQLGFVAAVAKDMVIPFICAKLTGGITAAIIALLMSSHRWGFDTT